MGTNQTGDESGALRCEQAQGSTQHPLAAPNGARAWATNGLIAAFLLYQILAPVHYYVGGDESDERFAWRMFSAPDTRFRNEQCDISVTETVWQDGRFVDRPFPVRAELVEGWIQLAARNRAAVVDGLLRWRCRQPGVRAVRLDVRCTASDGTGRRAVAVRCDCPSGLIQRERLP